jgi:flavin reductase (NADH)
MAPGGLAPEVSDAPVVGAVRQAGLESDAFREAMSLTASGVAIITAMDLEKGPRGFTCTSMCSVSLVPPMLLVCAHHRSRTLEAARSSGYFAVNALHSAAKPVAELFASAETDKFGRVNWRPGPAAGLPWLDDVTTVFVECSVAQCHPAGDHYVLVGLALSAQLARGWPPLAYSCRSYAAVGSHPLGAPINASRPDGLCGTGWPSGGRRGANPRP